MPSLERFFPPIARFFDTNVKSLPNSRLYFFKANSTTLKATFKDKVGDTAHANPVEADASGKFPPIFLSGLYRVELRNKDNIVQPGWPVDNVGQDSAIVPFAPWSEIVTYQTDDVVTSPDGFWFRSIGDGNLGNDPDGNPDEWELLVIPIAANFTSDSDWFTWSDDGTRLSLDVDFEGIAGVCLEVDSGSGGARSLNFVRPQTPFTTVATASADDGYEHIYRKEFTGDAPFTFNSGNEQGGTRTDILNPESSGNVTISLSAGVTATILNTGATADGLVIPPRASATFINTGIDDYIVTVYGFTP